MQHHADLAGDVDEVRHVAVDHPEPRLAHKMGHVVGRAGRQVVQTDDLVAREQQAVAEMRPEESGPSRHDRPSHLILSLDRPKGSRSASARPEA